MSLLVFGMDGASKKYIEEAIDRGMMPNMEELVDEGFLAEMDSVIPPTTLPAWVSMFSGQQPGSLGFYHMTELDTENGLSPSSSDIWRGQMVWDKTDAKYDLINVPGNSPVWPINGVMVEGFPMVSDPSGYPEEADEKLEELEFREESKATTAKEKFNLYHHNFDQRAALFSEIGSDADVRIEVYQITDTASHKAQNIDQLLKSYGKIDEVLGERMEEYDDILIVSDHGFKKVNRFFYINTWLKNQGYLEIEGQDQSDPSGVLFSIKSYLAGTKLKPYLKTINDLVASKIGKDFSPTSKSLDKIDFESSDAYCYRGSANSYADVNINDKSKKEEIRSKLEAEEIIEEVVETEELYDKREGFPDLVAKTVENAGSGMQPAKEEYFRTQAFIHSRTGIIAGKGKSFDSELKDRQELVDVAPTVAHYLGQEIDCDGDVIYDLFSEKFEPKELSEISDIDI